MTLTKLEKLMLINAQPVKFWLNLAGGLIALYFLWEHNMLKAFLIGGAFILAGTIFATGKRGVNNDDIAKSTLGIIFLRYATKFGFSCYLTSHLLVPIAFWYHNLVLTVVGLIILIIGQVRLKSLF